MKVHFHALFAEYMDVIFHVLHRLQNGSQSYEVCSAQYAQIRKIIHKLLRISQQYT